MSLTVAVLMGGWSSEREVSLVSGAAVVEALKALGHDVRPIDVTRNMAALISALTPAPDVVFNALHGRFGEDGCMQGLLDMLAIPYTHSGVLASALAMDKPVAIELFRSAGIPCAEHRIVSRDTVLAGGAMAYPYVVKPLNDGSSVGVHIVTDGAGEEALKTSAESLGETLMVERYVPGRELAITVMDDRALGVTEIVPRDGFYDYETKYTDGKADHVVPADLPDEIYAQVMDLALRAHRVLGCRGVSRADIRYDDTKGQPGRLVMLEVNTQPGLTPLSLAPEAAAHAGIDFNQLISWMVEAAKCDG